MDSLPGVFATMDEQCRYDFGKGYEKCEVKEPGFRNFHQYLHYFESIEILKVS